MREDFVFGSLEKSRERLVKQVENLTAEQANLMPTGFKNNVLWHLGHILTVADSLLYGFSGQEGKVPAAYRGFFGNGTKPADWTDEVPTLETILAQLKDQPGQLRAAFEGKFDEAVKENFFKAGTVGELFQSTLLHEAGHTGNINAMLKLVQ